MSGRKVPIKNKTGPKRTGQNVACEVCATVFYRDAAYIARTKRMTCSRECYRIAFSGSGNNFWNRTHSEETRAKIKEAVAKNPAKGTGPKKGVFKQSPEAKLKMSIASKERWRVNRDAMLASQRNRPRKSSEEIRYRRSFNKWQRKEWLDTKCAWCNSTHGLELDHIIPVICGGTAERRNAQTLCRHCNVWKMSHIDRQLYLAGLDLKVG